MAGSTAFTICAARSGTNSIFGVTSVNYDFAELVERGEGAV